LFSARRARVPQQEARIPRFSPAFAPARFSRNAPGLPGSGFGTGRLVMRPVSSFSNTIRSWSQIRRIDTFSAQSFRRSVTCALIRAIASRVFSRFREPFRCLFIRRWSARYRSALRSLILGAR
jgi:hypothetical protein